MRIVTYGGAVRLDGFLADANGAIDWLHFSKDVQQVTADYWKDVHTILMGRKTYQVALAQGTGSREPSASGHCVCGLGWRRAVVTVILGIVLLGEPANAGRMISVALIIARIIGLKLA
jgi:hypothetical protein